MKSKLKNINSNTGKFIDGNPTSGELGTIVTAEWLNGVQERVQDIFEELKNVLALANLQPDGNKTTQVADAIRAYVQTFNLKIESNTRSLANVIPNSKKSSAVNSNSADTVATSTAVKIAYDKGVEAKNAADGAQRTANDGVSKADAAQRTANSAVTKADNAQLAADNANNNANNRVSKSGDTMTGILNLNLTDALLRFQRNGVNKSAIGFRNETSEDLLLYNYAFNTEFALRQHDLYCNKSLNLPGAVFENGDYAGFNIKNGSGRYVRVEGNPHSDRGMMTFVYREASGVNIHAVFLPKKDGTILLDSDISHATNGTNKAKVASEFALGEMNKTKANLADFSYQKIGNFEIRKYPDGTMIQTYFIDQYDLKDWKEKSFNWARAFVGVPMIFGGILTSANWSHFCSVNILKKSNHATCYYWEYEIASDNQGDVRIQFLAIGRWK